MNSTAEKTLHRWAEKFNTLTLRERAMVAFAMLALLYGVWDFVFMKPLYATQSRLVELTQQTKREISEVNAQIQAVTAQFNLAKQQSENSEVSSLKNVIAENNKQIESLIYDFIRPKQMAMVLKELLDREQSLKLMRLQSTGAKSLLDPQSAPHPLAGVEDEQYRQVKRLLTHYRQQLDHAQAVKRPELNRFESISNSAQSLSTNQASPEVYRHGLEIEFVGDFPGTLRYLRAIEALPWRFYWDDVTFNVKKHPHSQVIIRIHTMSLDQSWIGV